MLLYLIIPFLILLYILLIVFTLHNLRNFSMQQRICIIVGGIIILLFVTFLIGMIGTSGIHYENEIVINTARNWMLLVFTPINGIITLPFAANLLSKCKEGLLEDNQIKKRIIIIVAVLILFLLLETGYIKDFTNGAISLINA